MRPDHLPQKRNKAMALKHRLLIPESAGSDHSNRSHCCRDGWHWCYVQSSFYRDFYKREVKQAGNCLEFMPFTDFPADLSEPVIVRFFRNAVFSKPLLCRSSRQSVLALSIDVYPVRPANSVS